MLGMARDRAGIVFQDNRRTEGGPGLLAAKYPIAAASQNNTGATLQ
jgi:hypothetical protein